MDVQDFKDKLSESLVSSFCWLDTKSMLADSLTKESKYSEDLGNAVLENSFPMSLSEYNRVSFKDGEIKMENQINKQELESETLRKRNEEKNTNKVFP